MLLKDSLQSFIQKILFGVEGAWHFHVQYPHKTLEIYATKR